MKKGLILFLLVSVIVSAGWAGGQTGAEPEEPIELEFGAWHYLEPARQQLLRDFAAEFEQENPGVRIVELAIAYSDFTDKLAISFGAGAGPDMMEIKEADFVPWLNQGFIEPLDQYVDFSPYDLVTAAQIAVVGGKRYAIPEDMGIYAGLIYNTEMYAAQGLDAPTNVDEFYNAAKKLTNPPEQFGLAHPVDPANSSYIMQGGMIFINGYGGMIARKGVITVNEPAFIEGVKAIKRFYDAGVTPAGMDFRTQRKMVWLGKVAQVLDGSYLFGWIKNENPDIYPKIAAAPNPLPLPNCPGGMNWFAVSSTSKHKVEAAKFMEFLLHDDVQSRWFEASVSIVATKKAVTPQWLAKNPWFKVYAEGADYAVPRTVEGLELYSSEIRKIVADHIGDVLVNDVPAEAAMNDCKKELDQLIERKKES